MRLRITHYVLRAPQLEYTALILLYWLTRTHALLALPAFFDESVHIRWAKLAWALQPFHAASDGRLLNIWAYAAFFPFGDALWIARGVTVLAGALGFAALLALGERLFSRRAALLAGLIYLALPYAFFYERMALADPFAAPLVTLALLGAVLALEAPSKTGRALLAGALLAALLLTKLTDLLFAPLPLAVWLLYAPSIHSRGNRKEAHGGLSVGRPPREKDLELRARDSSRRPRGGAQNDIGWVTLKSTAVIYGAAAVIVVLVVVALKVFANSDLGFDLITARIAPAPLAERLPANAQAIASYAWAYVPWPILVLLGLGLWASVRNRNGLLLAGLGALPLGALLLGSNIAESRFLVPILPLLALLAGFGADWALAWLPNFQWRAGAAAALALLLAATSGRFFVTAWGTPRALPLIAWDRYQYVEEWPAGFGLRETGALMFGPGAERPLDVVVSDEGHIPQLSLYAPWEPHLHSLYEFNDGGVRLLYLRRESNDPYAGLADPKRATLYVVEVPRYQAERDGLAANLALLARFERPGGKSAIEVYRLSPENNP